MVIKEGKIIYDVKETNNGTIYARTNNSIYQIDENKFKKLEKV